MNENVVLLRDHVWYAVMDKEQAQNFVNHHKYTVPNHYGVYIDKCGRQTLLFKEEDKDSEDVD